MFVRAAGAEGRGIAIVLLSSAFAYFPLVSDMAFVPCRKHDLFLSYAHIEAAWAECFRKALCDEFQVRTGEQVTIWQDT